MRRRDEDQINTEAQRKSDVAADKVGCTLITSKSILTGTTRIC